MADEIKRERLPFTIIEDSIIEDLDISKHGLLVYLVLCKHADQNGKCFPSIGTVAKFCRCAKSSAQEGIAELIKKGYIEKKVKFEKKRQSSNLYTIKSQLIRSHHRVPHSGRGGYR